MATESAPSSSSRFLRRYDDNFTVRHMTPDDVATVVRWYSDICPTSVDLPIAHRVSAELDSENDRFLVGDLDGKTIASKVEINVGGRVSYGSLFYVEEAHRMHGYGRRINDVAAEVGDRLGLVVGIDAHDELESMNFRRGYRTAFKVTQFRGKVDEQMAVGVEDTATRSIHQITDTLFDAVVKYDDQCYVISGSCWRRRLLENWVAIPGGRALVAMAGDGETVVGYGCRRPATHHATDHLIGPLYADSLDVARDLVAALTRDIIGHDVWINICEPNVEAVRLVNDLKLSDSLHMLRMYRNESTTGGQDNTVAMDIRLVPSNRVFAITSIDVCGY